MPNGTYGGVRGGLISTYSITSIQKIAEDEKWYKSWCLCGNGEIQGIV